jgi:hypothetical protein
MSDSISRRSRGATAIAWKMNGLNSLLYSNDESFYISYNISTARLGHFFAGDGTGEETALCRDGEYFILNGDHRAKYESLIGGGWEACMGYFKQHPDEVSSWSNKVDEA